MQHLYISIRPTWPTFRSENGLGAEYIFFFGSIDDLPHTTHNLAANLALERAAPLRPLGGHLSLVQGGRLVREVARETSRHRRCCLQDDGPIRPARLE